MDISLFCIATITLARDPQEEALLRSSLLQLSAVGAPVFVTDGGSSPSFLAFVNQLPNTTLLQAGVKGVMAQAKNSLLEAAKAALPFIFYTEPDKGVFFKHHLPSLLARLNPDKKTGVIIAARSPEGFATFPAFQQMTETTINHCCAELIGPTADYCYGPFLFNTQLVPFLNEVQEDIGWGWRPFVFHVAHRLGYKVEIVEGHYVCPPQQRTDDTKERVYRMKQLEQNIRGLVLSASLSLKEQ